MNHQYIIIYSPKLQEKQIKTEGTINIMIEKPHSKTICSSPSNYLTIRFQIPPHPSQTSTGYDGMPICHPRNESKQHNSKQKSIWVGMTYQRRSSKKSNTLLWENGHSRSWNKKVLTIILVVVKEKQCLRKE